MLKDLPVVITGPGLYKTRGGKLVTIHNLDGQGTFSARGSIWRKPDKPGKNPIFNIWHISGRIYILQESDLDIVEKID